MEFRLNIGLSNDFGLLKNEMSIDSFLRDKYKTVVSGIHYQVVLPVCKRCLPREVNKL